jgi:hypothetical protein
MYPAARQGKKKSPRSSNQTLNNVEVSLPALPELF